MDPWLLVYVWFPSCAHPLAQGEHAHWSRSAGKR